VPSKLVRVHSESPKQDLWIYFRRFEVIDSVQARTKDGLRANAEAVRHCVRQARDYFASASAASLMTRPVLLYYGMVTLAKLLLLVDHLRPLGIDDIEELERNGGHGLKQRDPDNASSGPYHLEAGSVIVTAGDRKGGGRLGRGIFPQLADRICPKHGETWLDQQVPLFDLLRAIPQLDLLMREGFGDRAGFSGLWVPRFDRGYVEIRVSDTATIAVNEVQGRIAYLDSERYSVRQPSRADSQLYALDVAEEEQDELLSREEFSEHDHVLPATLLGDRLEGLLAQYMVMYALSIVARYKPHRWAEILQGETGVLPILEKLMTVAERWWPNLVLNRLTSSAVLFAPTMY